jgi:hypothetical protein
MELGGRSLEPGFDSEDCVVKEDEVEEIVKR